MPMRPPEPEPISSRSSVLAGATAGLRRLWQRWQSAPVGLRSHIVALVVVAVAFFAVSDIMRNNLSRWSVVQRPSWVGQWPGKNVDPTKPVCDLDTRLIHDGLLRAPHFQDTLRWWTGTWAGQIPFYRPLTSWLFWGEWKAFGDFETRWHCIANVMHLAAVYQFALLACALFRYFRLPRPWLAGILTGLAFVQGLYALPEQNGIVVETFGLWKNQPDSLGLALFCWSLRLYLRRIEGEEDSALETENRTSPPTRRRLAAFAPLGVYLLVCATKEAGIFLPLLLPLLESRFLRAGGPGRLRAIRRLAPMLIALPLFFLFRAGCLHDAVGFRYGSDHAWAWLLASNLAGRLSQIVVEGQWLPLVMSMALLAALARLDYGRRRIPPFSRRQNLVTFGIGTTVTMSLALLSVSTEDTGIVRLAALLLLLLIPTVMVSIVGATLFVLAAGLLGRERPALAAFAYLWALLATGLTLFSPTMLHRFYLVNAGFALLMGGGWGLFLERCRELKRPGSVTPANP